MKIAPALLLLLLGYGAFHLIAGQTTTWHQRMTVTLSTPTGEVQGSSVTKVSIHKEIVLLKLPQISGMSSTYQGEAVVVEVLPDRYLFALVDSADVWAYTAFDLRHMGQPEAMAKLFSQPHDTPMPLLPTDVDAPLPRFLPLPHPIRPTWLIQSHLQPSPPAVSTT